MQIVCHIDVENGDAKGNARVCREQGGINVKMHISCFKFMDMKTDLECM